MLANHFLKWLKMEETVYSEICKQLKRVQLTDYSKIFFKFYISEHDIKLKIKSRICTHFYSECAYNQKLRVQIIGYVFCIFTFCMHAPSWKLHTEFACTCVYGIFWKQTTNKTKPPNHSPLKPPDPSPLKPQQTSFSFYGAVGLNRLADLFYDIAYNQSPFSVGLSARFSPPITSVIAVKPYGAFQLQL